MDLSAGSGVTFVSQVPKLVLVRVAGQSNKSLKQISQTLAEVAGQSQPSIKVVGVLRRSF